MVAERNNKTINTLEGKDNNEKDRKKLKEYFQTGKVCKTTAITLFCKSGKSKHKNA